MSSDPPASPQSSRRPSCGSPASSGLLPVAQDGGGHSCQECGSHLAQGAPGGAGPSSRPPRARRVIPLAIARLLYAPTKTFSDVGVSVDFRHALMIVLVFAIISNVAGVFITEGLAEVAGYSAVDAVHASLAVMVGTIVAVLSFFIFCVVASFVASRSFHGLGDREATIALVSLCYPWLVVLSVTFTAMVALAFEGQFEAWDEHPVVLVGAMTLTGILAISWVVWLTSKAVGTANDIATGHAFLCVLVAGVASGLVTVLVESFVRLPMGLGS